MLFLILWDGYILTGTDQMLSSYKIKVNIALITFL